MQHLIPYLLLPLGLLAGEPTLTELQAQAENGNTAAMTNLGYKAEEAKDYPSAIRWYSKAAERGNAQAKYNLAVLHYTGAVGKPDYASSYRLLKELESEKDNKELAADSQFLLALHLAGGLGCPADLTRAEAIYKDLAASGHRDAAYQEARLLEKRGSCAEAIALYRIAAAQGHHDAQVAAGALLLKGGDGITKDEAAGAKLLEEAVNAGHKGARAMYAQCLQNGRGLPKDEAKALEVYQTLIKEDPRPEILVNAGLILYSQGKNSDAAALYRQALEKNPPAAVRRVAHFNLAVLLDDPKSPSIKEDSAQIYTHLRQALLLGHAKAAYLCANKRKEGRGCEENLAEAQALLLLSRQLGYTDDPLEIAEDKRLKKISAAEVDKSLNALTQAIAAMAKSKE